MSRAPVLKRFDVNVFKNKDANDPAQVPAAAAIVFYGQGATINDATIQLAAGSTYDGLIVYNTGSFPAVTTQSDGYLDANPLTHCLISMNPTNATLNVTNVSGYNLTLSRGMRFWNFGRVVQAYSDPVGLVPVSVSTDPVTGRAGCYIKEYRYDYIVSITGGGQRLFVDEVGSLVMR